MLKTDAQPPDNVMVKLKNGIRRLTPLKLASRITGVRNQTVLKRNVTSIIVKVSL